MNLIDILDEESVDLLAKLERSIDATKNKTAKLDLVKTREAIHLMLFDRKNSKFSNFLYGALMFVLTLGAFFPTLFASIYFINFIGLIVFALNGFAFYYFKLSSRLQSEIHDLRVLRLNIFIKKLFKELLQ